MYSVSEDFLYATQHGGNVITRLDVLSERVIVASGLPVTGGSAQVDYSAATRRRMDCSLVDTDGTVTPYAADDLLAPYGNEIALYRGFDLGGTEELVPLGVFRISDSDVKDSGGKTISLTGYDRSRSVSRARLEQPYTIASGTNYATAIQALIESRLPGLTFNFNTTTHTTPLIVLAEESDPWAEATKMASACGMILYFDVLGNPTLIDEPDVTGQTPVVTFTEGANAVVIEADRKFSDEGGYNGLVVMGEPVGGNPIRAAAYDSDPSSPTYYLGKYGKVPEFLRSELITTQAQADAAALAGVNRKSGVTEGVSIVTTVNPALEAGDIAQLQRASLELDDPFILDSFAVPLTVSESMTITMRNRRQTTL